LRGSNGLACPGRTRQGHRRPDRPAARHGRRLDLRAAIGACNGLAGRHHVKKLARAKNLGANKGINYKSTPDWEKAAMEFTVGRGVDQVVEVGGAGTLARSFGAIRAGGKISMIGGLSGPATELNPGLILARRANVQGISVGSTQMFEAMNRAIAANGIKPVIDKVFGFDEVQAAYKHMASGTHFGKIVIRVA
jgi:NADPH:quinone reductase-like Zn-dependent oxidoreductase